VLLLQVGSCNQPTLQKGSASCLGDPCTNTYTCRSIHAFFQPPSSARGSLGSLGSHDSLVSRALNAEESAAEAVEESVAFW